MPQIKCLLLSLVLFFASLPLFSADRIFFNVENSALLPYIDNTLVPAYLPDAKCVYWQFYSEWTFTGYSDKSQMILDIDQSNFGRANVWSYGFNKASQYVHFNIIGDGTYTYPFVMQVSGVNFACENTLIEFLDTKPLPTERNWKTAKQFCSLLVQNADFMEFYNERSTTARVAVTLGYSANNFAEQELDKLYWSAAIVENWDSDMPKFRYCYADAYTLEQLYCYNTGIEKEHLSNSFIYPNPATDNTTLTLELQQPSRVSVTLNDILGREIKQIYNAFTDAGTFTHSFTTQELPKGIYYLKILSGGEVKVEKVVVN
ncbi:MAG: T9SS type A sorting domain-containing protein [Ignavibacteria bacterium]|jgi:hypothetical protein|nr:T9SS type A sorting domain-containing protein [Ignavibacteria bacterium]